MFCQRKLLLFFFPSFGVETVREIGLLRVCRNNAPFSFTWQPKCGKVKVPCRLLTPKLPPTPPAKKKISMKSTYTSFPCFRLPSRIRYASGGWGSLPTTCWYPERPKVNSISLPPNDGRTQTKQKSSFLRQSRRVRARRCCQISNNLIRPVSIIQSPRVTQAHSGCLLPCLRLRPWAPSKSELLRTQLLWTFSGRYLVRGIFVASLVNIPWRFSRAPLHRARQF